MTIWSSIFANIWYQWDITILTTYMLSSYLKSKNYQDNRIIDVKTWTMLFKCQKVVHLNIELFIEMLMKSTNIKSSISISSIELVC